MKSVGIVLAAGTGKRLRPLTQWVPKSLAFLPGGTLLDHHIKSLEDCGAARAIVVTGHLSEVVCEHIERRRRDFSIPVSTVKQTGPEGLLYALNDALPKARAPIIVLHGDGFLGSSLRQFRDPLALNQCSIAVKPETNPKAEPTKDLVSIDEMGHVLAFGRRVEGARAGDSFGCYSLGSMAPALIQLTAAAGVPDADMIPVFQEMLRHMIPIRAIGWDGPHFNLNTEQDFLDASRLILRSWSALSYPRPEDGVYVPEGMEKEVQSSQVIGPSWVSHTATLQGSTIGPYTAVGETANIHDSRLQECLVFPCVDVRSQILQKQVVYQLASAY